MPVTRVWVAYCPNCRHYLTGWHDTTTARDNALTRHNEEVMHA